MVPQVAVAEALRGSGRLHYELATVLGHAGTGGARAPDTNRALKVPT